MSEAQDGAATRALKEIAAVKQDIARLHEALLRVSRLTRDPDVANAAAELAAAIEPNPAPKENSNV